MSAEPFPTEDELERMIAEEADLLANAKTVEDRFASWNRLLGYHAMRSPRKVAELEQERGLRNA